MQPGEVCWVDLAASDLAKARRFYGELFGWEAKATRLNEGSYLQLLQGGRPFGSMYQMDEERLRRGAPSHWLPYVRVEAVERACVRASDLGGRLLVRPFDAGPAAIAVILDATGAPMGLWQDT